MSQDSLDDFARLVTGSELRLNIVADSLPEPRRPGKTDALFHLPLLALCTLVIAKLGPLTTDQTGRRVALLLIGAFQGLRNVNTLEWSMTLRRRCAEALTFLEAAKLVQVANGGDRRAITLTAGGKTHFAKGYRDESDLGHLVRRLVRAQSRLKLGTEET
jgi:hypothetical protein